MILRIFHALLFTASMFLVFHCKKEASEVTILKIQEDQNLNAKEAISKILPLLFPYVLKDWNLEEDQKTKKWNLTVSYGGSTALTFQSQKEYIENSLLTHSMYNARLVAAVKNLPIHIIRLSLTKPLYVKGENHPDVGIQEFEILRTSLSVEEAKKTLNESKEISPFSESKLQKLDVIALFEKIQKISSFELNQLKLITVE